MMSVRYGVPVLLLAVIACAHVGDSVQPFHQGSSSGSVKLLENLPDFETGPSPYDCGPESASYVLRYYGRSADLDKLTNELVRPEKKGTAIEVLLAYFQHGSPGDHLDARLINQDREVLQQAIDHSLMPIAMVDVGRFPAGSFRAAESLYAGQFHFYPLVGYGPNGVVVAESEGLTHIRWNLFDRMWSKAGGRMLLIWDQQDADALRGTRRTRRQYNRAVSLIDQESYGRALETLNNIIDEQPLFARPYGSLGFIRFKQKRYEEAERYYRNALARHPGLMRVQNNLAHLLVRKGEKRDEAEQRVNAIIMQTSEKLHSRRNQSGQEKMDEQKQKELERRLAKAYHTRGRLRQKRKQWEAARADYYESLRLSAPDQTVLRYRLFKRLGQVQNQLKQWIEARRSYDESLQLAQNEQQRRAVRRHLKQLKKTMSKHLQKSSSIPE